MANLSDVISAILSRLAQLLGLKPSEAQRLQQMTTKLAVAKATNIDRLEALKDKIKVLEAQILRKKRELDQARHDTRRIVAGEIERLFRDVDRLHGQEKIISNNLERLSVAQTKLDELAVAQDAGLEEGQLDDIAVALQGAVDGLKQADDEVKDLEKVEYEGPQRDHIDVDDRMTQVEGNEVTKAGLSPETEERIKQLEADDV